MSLREEIFNILHEQVCNRIIDKSGNHVLIKCGVIGCDVCHEHLRTVADAILKAVEVPNVNEIARCLKETHDKYEHLKDYEKVALPEVGIMVYAKAISGLIKSRMEGRGRR